MTHYLCVVIACAFCIVVFFIKCILKKMYRTLQSGWFYGCCYVELHIPCEAGNLTVWATISFWRRTVFHGVCLLILQFSRTSFCHLVRFVKWLPDFYSFWNFELKQNWNIKSFSKLSISCILVSSVQSHDLKQRKFYITMPKEQVQEEGKGNMQ